MTPPTIILDLDGALIHSAPGIWSSCVAALRALGHEPDPGFDLTALISPPVEEVMRLLLEPYGDDRVSEGVAAYRADYGQRGLFESVVYPGIPEALQTMLRGGAQLILATSKRTEFAQRILRHVGLDDLFAAIHGSEPGGLLDHKPELLAYVMERNGLKPRYCVMVGDRRYDIVGAHVNGMRALGVLWGYGGREELEAARADALVGEPAGLAAAALEMARTG
jgi:phosphoglycolate phosphatase